MRLFGNRDKKYLKIAFPSAMEGIFISALSAADIIMVGVLGTAAIAGVSIFTQPRMMILCVTRSIAAALTIVAAERFGAGDRAGAGRMTTQTMALSTLLLTVIHIGFYINLESILRWMGADDTYIALAMEYSELALLGVFFTSLAAILQALLLGFGKTAFVFSINLQGNIINVIGNFIFIFGFGPIPAYGVFGAAIGTILGTAWTLLLTLRMSCKERVLHTADILPDRAYFRKFLPVFGSIFSEQGFERIGMVLYTRMVAELGVLAYAIHAICMNFCDFYYAFAAGLGKGSTILAGHAVGAKDEKAWREAKRLSFRWAFIFSTISFVLTYIFREEIFMIYSTDPEALYMGAIIMAVVALVSFPEGHQMVGAGILRASGKTKAVATYSFVSVAFLRPIITALFLYEFGWGLIGAWAAVAIDQSIRAGAATWLLSRLRWERVVR
ncbi:MATE family efflux transporter [Selenomonas sp. TAMA-11512]|nr:MATE family efflux transporter [Selenomonas sp. TAMA-11512]